MGTKTSVYLNDETAAAVKASGLTLAEIIRRGLEPPPQTVVASGPVTVMAVSRSADSATCPHRGLSPGAWCKSCQSAVPATRGKS